VGGIVEGASPDAKRGVGTELATGGWREIEAGRCMADVWLCHLLSDEFVLALKPTNNLESVKNRESWFSSFSKVIY
jgi:hypothetical protein